MLERARTAGVSALLVPGVDEAQLERAAGLHEASGIELRFAVGIHPCADGDVVTIERWIDRLDARAIGELGWDRGAPFDDARVDALIELARARDLPIIVHVVGAHGHALERLRRHGELRGVVHAYSGSRELVREYVALGLHVSIGPSVLRPEAKRVFAAARAVPGERLLIETDAPDQAPEPADLRRVAERLAEVRGVALEELAAQTTANAEALFSVLRRPGA